MRSLSIPESKHVQEIPLGGAAKEALKLASQKGVKLVLIEAHAVNLYSGKPRHSVDVDFIADKPELLGAIEGLTVENHDDVVRYVDGSGSEVLDFVRPNNALMRHVLKTAKPHKSMLVPDVESLLALKYQSMTTLSRKYADRHQDAVDFRRVAENNRSVLDRNKLNTIGELLGKGIGKALLDDVDNALNNRPIEIP